MNDFWTIIVTIFVTNWTIGILIGLCMWLKGAYDRKRSAIRYGALDCPDSPLGEHCYCYDHQVKKELGEAYVCCFCNAHGSKFYGGGEYDRD